MGERLSQSEEQGLSDGISLNIPIEFYSEIQTVLENLRTLLPNLANYENSVKIKNHLNKSIFFHFGMP